MKEKVVENGGDNLILIDYDCCCCPEVERMRNGLVMPLKSVELSILSGPSVIKAERERARMAQEEYSNGRKSAI